MTAVLLMLRAQGPVAVHAALIGVGAIAVVSPRALVAPAMWWVAAAMLVVRLVADWPLADNHIYLLTYWCVAIAIALGAAVPHEILGRSARWLIGAAFALAVIWKAALSPDFVDGRFFRMTLIVDERFEDVVRLAGAMSLEEIERHRAGLAPLGAGAELAPDPSLVEPAAFQRLALLMSWTGLVLEAALAIAFLAPIADRQRWIRHALLIGFCVATYPVAPVAGFGWLLLAMGASQSPPGSRWSTGYIAAWLVVLAGTELPWAAWLVALLGRP